MFGYGLLFLVCLAVALVLTLWMVVRIWRRSPLLAILSLLFWPASIVALIIYWGDEDSDIRVPFFLSFAATLLLSFMAMRTVDAGINEMAYMLSDEEIAEIRRNDPALADKLERARAEAFADDEDYEDEDEEYSGAAPQAAAPRVPANPASRVESAAASQASAHVSVALPSEAELAAQEAQHRIELAQAATALSWRVGTVDLSPAPARLKLPSQFRLLARQWLIRLARLHGVPYDNHSMGWIVHQNVDLGREDAWFVQVRYLPQAERFTPPSVAFGEDTPEAQDAFVARIAAKAEPSSTEPPVAMAWDRESGIATWRNGEEGSAAPIGYYAARVIDGGLLVFVVSNLDDAHAELAERSVRLIASRASSFKRPQGE